MRALACGALLSLTLATHARADDLPQPTPNDRVWYGWQTLLVDAAAIGALAPTAASWSQTANVLGPISAALFVSAPVMHALQHRWGAFGTSLALRVLLGFAAATVGLGVGAGSCFCDLTTYDQASEGLYLGALVGMSIASAIDAAVLGWRPRFKLRTTPAWNVLPNITPHGGGVALVRMF